MFYNLCLFLDLRRRVLNQRRFIFSNAQLPIFVLLEEDLRKKKKPVPPQKSSDEFVKKSTEGERAIWESFEALTGTVVLHDEE